jgi:putative CocE/NonD family hydrolase
MNPLARLVGLAVDRAMGMPGPGVPVVIRRNLRVPMPDGVVLLGDHYRPARATGPLAVVLIRSPYGRAGLAGAVFGAPIARQGFQMFIQSTRGTFGSGGQFRPFLHERADGLATVAWLREQPWCDGRVATIGGSYLGHTQWAVAPYVDPPLESVSLNVTAARITSAFYEHGAPGLKNALNWTGQIGRQERGVLPLVPSPARLAAMRRALRKIPLQAADVAVAGAPVPFWRDFVDHASPEDDFWAPADHDHADLTRLPPVSMVTGWWDLFLAEQLRDYAAIRAAGVKATLLVGPWLHGEPGEVRAIAQQDTAWLSHHLNGAPAPSGAPVRVYLQQAGTWLEFDQWPPAGITPASYYLRASGRLATEPEPGDPRPAWFSYDPADPTPSPGGPLLAPPGKQADNADVESRSDVLTFTSEPLTADTDLIGPVSARIYVRTEHPYADVFVRLCDVDDKGVSRNVVDGIRRLSPPTVPAKDVEAGDDGVLAVDLELFPTAYRMLAGHRIRVQVAGGAFPRYARNFGTADPFGSASSGVRNKFEVFADAAHQAHVVLPLAPAGG